MSIQQLRRHFIGYAIGRDLLHSIPLRHWIRHQRHSHQVQCDKRIQLPTWHQHCAVHCSGQCWQHGRMYLHHQCDRQQPTIYHLSWYLDLWCLHANCVDIIRLCSSSGELYANSQRCFWHQLSHLLTCLGLQLYPGWHHQWLYASHMHGHRQCCQDQLVFLPCVHRRLESTHHLMFNITEPAARRPRYSCHIHLLRLRCIWYHDIGL